MAQVTDSHGVCLFVFVCYVDTDKESIYILSKHILLLAWSKNYYPELFTVFFNEISGPIKVTFGNNAKSFRYSAVCRSRS
jgi:hypothetical protein